jgi:hypothetical protein
LKYLFLIVLPFVSACTTPTAVLAPPEMRKAEYKITNQYNKATNFDKAQSWAVKTSNNVQLRDRDSGTIITKNNVPCTGLKLGNGWAQGETLWFTLEIKTADKIVVATFSDLVAKAVVGWDSGMRPTNQAEVDYALKSCIAPLRISLETELK